MDDEKVKMEMKNVKRVKGMILRNKNEEEIKILWKKQELISIILVIENNKAARKYKPYLK
jgi:aspartokinase